MSSIGSVVGMMSSMLSGPGSAAGRAGRPDPSALADKMFSRIDGNGDGGVDKAELTSAMGRFSTGGASDTTSGIDKMFASFDADSSGTIYKQEIRDGVATLKQQLGAQLQQLRSGGGERPGALGGPPSPGGGQGLFALLDIDQDSSHSKAEFGATAQTSEQGALLSALIAKFDQAGNDSATQGEPDQWRKALDAGPVSSTAGSHPQSFDPVDGLMAMVARQYATSAPLATAGPSLQATA